MSVATEDPKLARRNPTLDGLRVVVVGLGKSGLAAARLAVARGARVTVVDDKPEFQLQAAAAAVRELGAELRAGGIHDSVFTFASSLVMDRGDFRLW